MAEGKDGSLEPAREDLSPGTFPLILLCVLLINAGVVWWIYG